MSRNYKYGMRFLCIDSDAKMMLHMSGSGLTSDRGSAWVGTLKQYDNMVRQNPDAKKLELIDREKYDGVRSW